MNYNYSHSIDDSSGYNPSDAVNDSGMSQDVNDRKGSRGRSGFDMRHNLTFNFLYELPIGPGKSFARDASGGAAKVLGGWQLSGIGSFHSNVPFTPVLGFDNANIQSVVSFSDRPNLIGDPFLGSVSWGGVTVQVPGQATPLTVTQAVQQKVLTSSLLTLTGGSYTSSSSLDPWVGYWVRASKPVTLGIPPPGSGSGTVTTPAAQPGAATPPTP